MAFKMVLMLACVLASIPHLHGRGRRTQEKWGNYKKYKKQAQEKNYETLEYTLKDDFYFQSFNIEQRLYPADRFSKATDTIEKEGMRKAKTRNFWKLFKYIQGANVKGAMIDMTVPVISSWGYANKNIQGATSMWFWLPKKYQGSEQPPTPTNEAEIDVWSDTTFYALRYTVDRKENDWEKKDGRWKKNKKDWKKKKNGENDEKKDEKKKAQILKHAEILENALKSKGASFDSSALYTAGYDGPWVKKGRRYDVMFKKTAKDDNHTENRVQNQN